LFACFIGGRALNPATLRTDNLIVVSSPPAPPPPIVAPMLSAQNLLELQAARKGLRTIRRAVSLACADGWTIGAFGALTLLLGLTDPSSVILGLAMILVAAVELRSAGRLRRLDPRAARVLGFNQVTLGSLLIVYALWRIWALFREGGASEALGATEPQLAQMLKPVENLTRLIGLAVYSTLIAIGMFAQGGMAWFYFTRQKHVRAYLAQTPAWIVGLQKAGMSF
jgi:hypothetical protein